MYPSNQPSSCLAWLKLVIKSTEYLVDFTCVVVVVHIIDSMPLQVYMQQAIDFRILLVGMPLNPALQFSHR
jgi:hypothetical protein